MVRNRYEFSKYVVTVFNILGIQVGDSAIEMCSLISIRLMGS